ncbi:MAG TPA: GAF domain-containing protein, partial [Candidatus Dormibacteraeota bacterium]|nr:GAF domain-containing protein [Candidatus Dormibacteraeota bacterium]
DLALLARLADVTADGRELAPTLASAARAVRDGWGLAAAGMWERQAGRLVPRAMAGAARPAELPEAFGILGRALEADAAVLVDPVVSPDVPLILGRSPEVAVPIPGTDGAWGLLWLAADGAAGLSDRDLAPAEAAARIVAGAVRAARLADDVAHQLHRADALRRVANDIGSRLDLEQILAGLVDHAMVLFEAERAAVFMLEGDGRVTAEVTRGLSDAYLASIRDVGSLALAAEATALRRPVFAIGYRQDPRAWTVRAAAVQEGFDTVCTAPLLAGDRVLGLIEVYHDRPHPWSDEELETMAAFAAQASVAVKAAQDFSQMATWAAQLQSIQQLGTRLNRLTSVGEIGVAIATELRQLIDYHNVRVYRIQGEDLIPVAMLGQVGEYSDETVEMLRAKVGHGITGWVAEHGIAQYLPDAANDPRAQTIPGTDEDLPESMLLAPMVFEDRVLGVVVLSKLGLDQFSGDDLRLLVIYASFAAQAMANADNTERLRAQSEALERQLRRQRELLGLTESMLTTLDPRRLLEQIADRLAALVPYDQLFVHLLDRPTGRLQPLLATGSHDATAGGGGGLDVENVTAQVLARGEPVLASLDPSLDALASRDEPRDAANGARSILAVPLLDREGVSGTLAVARDGVEGPFTPDIAELVQLFAAQVSIALQIATAHSAVEVRARSDDLTGLLNHGTLVEWLARSVAADEPFSLIMLDLDEFKAVNDRLGHQAGDRVLRDVAVAIAGAGRDSDVVFRYGGDEFVVLLPGTDATGARSAAHRMSRAVVGVGRADRRLRGLRIGASIGFAAFPVDGRTAEDILLAADRACFVAKRGGRGRIAAAEDGLALAAEFSLQAPTPVDPPTRVDAPTSADAMAPADTRAPVDTAAPIDPPTPLDAAVVAFGVP